MQMAGQTTLPVPKRSTLHRASAQRGVTQMGPCITQPPQGCPCVPSSAARTKTSSKQSSCHLNFPMHTHTHTPSYTQFHPPHRKLQTQKALFSNENARIHNLIDAQVFLGNPWFSSFCCNFCFPCQLLFPVCFTLILVLAKPACYLLISSSVAENVPARD